MSGSLKHADNICGQTLLRLSASGSSIIAELLRLSQNIPEVFLTSNNQYSPVMFDFAYMKNSEQLELQINANTGMLDLDQEFIDTFSDILARFYTLFESIVTYLEEYLDFIESLNSGIFIEYTCESVLQDKHGKQLMCECLYLYGAMLLLLERHIPGVVREKMVIAVMRHQSEASLEKLEQVCKLIRSTGYLGSKAPIDKKPKDYPEKFFARFPIDSSLVKMVIQTLQSDDIYLGAEAFPSPEHRSTRLANQAGMLYVILYFAPDILHSRDAEMREYVDKHYNDNWMITVHMGWVVDLSVQWSDYKAAKKALSNIMTSRNIMDAANQNLKWFKEAKVELEEFLTAGILNEQYVLININKLMQCLRKSNVALRWRLLHRSCNTKQIREMIANQLSSSAVIDLLLQSAQLEYKVKNIVGDLLDSKAAKWEEARSLCAGRLRELSDYFTGERALTRVKKDERMMKWFASIASEVDSLNESSEDGQQHSTVLGRKIQKAISALEEVEQFEQIDTDVQIKQFLEDTRELLKQMIRVVNVRRQDLTKIEVITDLSYAFEVLNEYTGVIHQRVRAEPSYSVLLRAGFVKLSSILDVPLTRINEINSNDVVSVAQFYSNELVNFMRRVLDIIPRSVFEILQKIITIQTSQLKPLPVKFESQYLKEYAQLDERFQLAEMTHRASTFTEGVLEMESTVLGIIKVDARQILHDGLRKELVRQVSSAMHGTLIFTNEKTGVASLTQADVRIDFNRQMRKLSSQMDGFRRSIEYIQDYVDMAGLKMWQEELSRIINFNIEQECNRYLKKKVLSHDSKHQSSVIPIPSFQVPANAGPINASATNFMGRTMNALLAMTDPGTTIFGPESIGWFNPDGAEVCGIKTFSTMNSAINVTGTSGLDRLLGFRIVHELNFFLRFYKESVQPFFPHLEQIRNGLFPDKSLPENATRLYGAGLKRFEKLMAPMLKVIMKIGQAQLLRRQLNQVLQFSCRLDANLLYQALITMDNAVLSDIGEHFRSPDDKPYPEPKVNPLLGQLNKLLEASGLSDPLAKIYIVTDPIESLPVLLMFFIVTYMSKLQWDVDFATLVRRKPVFAIDGMPLVVGIWTLLKQFHPSYTRQLLAYLGQFVRATMNSVLKADFAALANSKTGAIPLEVTNTLLFIDMFCKVGKIPRSAVAEFIPSYIFDAVTVPPPTEKK